MNGRTPLTVILLVPVLLMSQNWEWKTYASARQIRDMVLADSRLYCATEGGLLVFDTDQQTNSRLTNTEGLAGIDVTCLATDNEMLWIGYDQGLIQKFSLRDAMWSTIIDYSEYHIHDLKIHGDSLFVALNIGISLYLIPADEVKETYRHLGENMASDVAVQKIFFHDDELWAITDMGITHTRLDFSNLLDPKSWIHDSESDGLPDSRILSFVSCKGERWIGTESGLFEYRNGRWNELPGTGSIQPVDFAVIGDTVLALTDNALYRYTDSAWKRLYEGPEGGLSITADNEKVYAGTENGLALFSHGFFSGMVTAAGPAGNLFSDLEVDLNGTLWCCSSDFSGLTGHGFYSMVDDSWTVYDNKNMNGLVSNLAVCVMVDHENRKWIGTWGGGMVVFENDTTYAFYNPQNGYFSGYDNYPNYSVIKSIARDLTGTIWILNREASGRMPLVSVSGENSWNYYGTEKGFSSMLVWDIAVDLFNQKWITTARRDGVANGVFIYDDKGTPDDPQDDGDAINLNTSDGLLSNNVQAIAVDENNTVWLGTDLGLNYYSGNEIREQYGLQYANVRALLVDGANNLWVGTNNGLCYYSNLTYEWTCFNSSNSGLVSDEVISLALNKNTGELFIGTTDGLSRLKTPFSSPRELFSGLKIYPNPFIPTEHAGVQIENLPREVSVSIFSSNGYLVYQQPSSQVYGNTFSWNGKNGEDQDVSAGIYLVVVNNQKGEKSFGKVAIIR